MKIYMKKPKDVTEKKKTIMINWLSKVVGYKIKTQKSVAFLDANYELEKERKSH